MPYLILYVEDESAIVELVQIIVRHVEIELVSTFSASQGLKLARERRPDLMMLDVMIPDRSGWSVFEEVRGDPQLLSTPIIMLTGQMHRYRVKKEFESSPIDAYITKPFDVLTVRLEIEKMLAVAFWTLGGAPASRNKRGCRSRSTNAKQTP